MAVKVDEHISSPLSLKPLQVPKSARFQKRKYLKWYSISFHFPLCANFHNRCGSSRSSLLMKCKVAEQGLLSLSRPKWVKEEQQGLCDRQKRALILRGGEDQRQANERAKPPFLLSHLIKLKYSYWHLYRDGNHLRVTNLTRQIRLPLLALCPFILALKPTLPVTTHQTEHKPGLKLFTCCH